MTTRRTLLGASLATAALTLAGLPLHTLAQATDYPNRAITIMVGFPPGGGVDGPLRQLAEKMRQSLGVSVVVENIAGANQMLAIRKLMAAKPDGYTLFAGTGSSLSQNPVLNPALGYNPLNDFALIGRFAVSPAIIVVPASSPFQTFEELVAFGKANPGKLRYASAGIGSTSHAGIEVLAQKLGMQVLHVPYRGDSAAAVDTAEGRVDFGLNVSTTLIPFMQTGKLRMLATTSTKPLAFAPKLRSLATAAGPEMAILDPYTFYGLVGPKGLPQPIVERISRALNEATASAEIGKSYREVMLAEPVAESPAQYRSFLQKQIGEWTPWASKLEKAPS